MRKISGLYFSVENPNLSFINKDLSKRLFPELFVPIKMLIVDNGPSPLESVMEYVIGGVDGNKILMKCSHSSIVSSHASFCIFWLQGVSLSIAWADIFPIPRG